MDILKDAETVKQLGSILKTNVRACKAVGHPFVIQLGRIYLDMLNVYKCLSENISAAIQTNGEGSQRRSQLRSVPRRTKPVLTVGMTASGLAWCSSALAQISTIRICKIRAR